MHIDSYKIWSYNKEWKNGKQAKTSTIRRMLTSEDGIQGKEFLQLLSDLNDEELDDLECLLYCLFL